MSVDLRSLLPSTHQPICDDDPIPSVILGFPKLFRAKGCHFLLQLDVIHYSLLSKPVYWYMSDISFTYWFLLFLWAVNYNGWGSIHRKITQIKLDISVLKFLNRSLYQSLFHSFDAYIFFTLKRWKWSMLCSFPEAASKRGYNTMTKRQKGTKRQILGSPWYRWRKQLGAKHSWEEL